MPLHATVPLSRPRKFQDILALACVIVLEPNLTRICTIRLRAFKCYTFAFWLQAHTTQQQSTQQRRENGEWRMENRELRTENLEPARAVIVGAKSSLPFSYENCELLLFCEPFLDAYNCSIKICLWPKFILDKQVVLSSAASPVIRTSQLFLLL